ncbi:MAG: 50S ribosomal protein L22 [Coriobacteriales bacterium]|jgi:large subunit ribosomal protein L22|nr:50S ribosomal protein L22 [Coriobacteriales bacterium]
MEAKAQARYVRVSPRKARVVLDMIRGQQVVRAREILQFSDRNVSEVIEKCLDSAIANAEHEGVKAENLMVRTTFANEGPSMKRIRPRAKGVAARILKRTSHITVIVGTREEA